MTKTKGPNKGSFAKKIHTMMMNGTVTFIMAILLLMMLLPWQQNCRLPRGRRHTSHLNFLCMMGNQTRSNS
jgi:L-asparagine transporter-like permease